MLNRIRHKNAGAGTSGALAPRRHRRGLIFMAYFLLLSLIIGPTSVAAQVGTTTGSDEAADAPDPGQISAGDETELSTPREDYDRAIASLPTYQGAPVISGYSRFVGITASSDISERFFYSDGYFKESAAVYDPHLATMSLCLAGAAMASMEGGTVNYKNKSRNARELLDHIGCRDICVNSDFVTKPGEDTIGVTIARRDITVDGKDYTLIPIGLRGAGYESEWLGNMKMGPDGDSQGFRVAAERAKDVVDAYLKEYSIKPKKAKFWIAGFSRAGAVCDILTHLLTDDYDPSGANVYGYSFATPQGAYESTRSYPNSHCTINRADAVPCVAPSYMGFSHYGDDTLVEDPDAANNFQAYRIKVSFAVDIGPLAVPDSLTIEPVDSDMHSPREMVMKVLEALSATVAPDRAAYTGTKLEGEATLEEIFSRLLRFLMSSDSKHINDVIASISGFQNRFGVSGLLRLGDIRDAVHEGMAGMSQEERDNIYGTLWGWFRDSLHETLTEDEYQELGSMWKALVYVLIELAHYDYVHSGAEGFTLIGTLVKNATAIIAAHAPEVYFSAVKKRDDFYKEVAVGNVASADAFSLAAPASTDALIFKNDFPVARVKAGYIEATKDPLVWTGCDSLKGAELEPDAEEVLYSDRRTDEPRVMRVDPAENYEIMLLAAEAPEGLEIAGWTDETGLWLTHEESLTIRVKNGHAYHRLVKPIYRRPQPEPEEEEKTTPGQTPASSGSPLVWVLAGTGVAAAGGGGALLWRRKKRRARRRRSRSRGNNRRP